MMFGMYDMLGMTPRGARQIPDDANASIVADAFADIKEMEVCHKKLFRGGNDDENDNEGTDDGDVNADNEVADVEGGMNDNNDQMAVNGGVDNEDEGGIGNGGEGNNDEDGGGGGEEGNDDDDNNEAESDDDEPFIMTDMGWSALKSAIRSQVARKREANEKELELPSEESAPIARYNPKAHFRFKSEGAVSSVDTLLDSLLNCKLRSRPDGYTKEDPRRTQFPFEIRTYKNSCFDLEGDLIACCGDEYHNNIRDEKNFVGHQNVPIPTNVDEATNMCVKDADDSNEPWDTNTVCRVFRGGKERVWFENCIADAENNLVWAACSRTRAVQAYSTDGGKSPLQAVLSFPDPIVKVHNKRTMGPFSLARSRNTLIGNSVTGCLKTWNIKSTLEEFGSDKPSSKPNILRIGSGENFLCGDVQAIADSQLPVAPYREWGGNKTSSTVRIYDIQEEKVVGLLAGTTGGVSVGRQFCINSHDALFVMSDSVGVLFDIRTHLPGITLLTGGRNQQILGVPTVSCPVAFTVIKMKPSSAGICGILARIVTLLPRAIRPSILYAGTKRRQVSLPLRARGTQCSRVATQRLHVS